MFSGTKSQYADTLASVRCRYISTRATAVQQLRATADRIERTNYYGEAGKIASSAIGVGGGLTVAGAAALTFLCAAVTAPITAPIITGAGVVASVSSIFGGACQVGMRCKNNWRQADLEQALRDERKVMQELSKELEQLPFFRKGLAEEGSAQYERLMLVYGILSLNALGVSCSAEHVALNAEVVSKIVGDAQCNSVELADVPHNKVIEKLMGNFPGVEQFLDSHGILEMGADSCGEAFGEMIFNNVLPVSTVMLPYHVWSLACDSKNFHEKHYMRAAKAVRACASKMEEDGESHVAKIDEAVEGLSLMISATGRGIGLMSGVGKLVLAGVGVYCTPWIVRSLFWVLGFTVHVCMGAVFLGAAYYGIGVLFAAR